jgi:hypothetical protein
MKNDSFNRSAGGFRPKDVSEFVNGHHPEPAQRQEGANQ